MAAQDGTAISGTRITWSGPCRARPAKFPGSFDGDTLIITTGDESPCAPVVLGLKKEPDKARFSLVHGRFPISTAPPTWSLCGLPACGGVRSADFAARRSLKA